MSHLLFFDTETTGIPEWQKPSGAECQPHLVQLAAVIVDEQTQEITDVMYVTIRADNWVIPQETIDIHGITNEQSLLVGVSEELAISQFINFWNGYKQIAFSTTFDRRIIRIALKRYMSKKIQDDWHFCDYECAMILAQKHLGLVKYPKLTKVYEHFYGIPLDGAHDAMADTIAAMKVYFSIKNEQKLSHKG